MKPVDRQKLCRHCEGRIAVEASSCPYCGMPLIGESETASSSVSQGGLSSQDSLASLYPPPYSSHSNRNFSQVKIESKDSQNKFKTPQALAENPFAKMPLAGNTALEKEQDQERAGFLPLLLLLLGSNLLTLGLLQFMFSNDGFLRLEWSSQYWYYYCLLALPLISFGMKKVKQPKLSA